MPDPDRPPDPNLEMRIAAIEKYWSAGAASLQKHPDRLPYASGLTASEKTTLGLQRWFADPEHGYSAERLRDLVRLFRSHGYAPGTASVGTIMGAPPSRGRDTLMLDAIKGRWSGSRVAVELKMRQLTTKRPGQGRTVQPPEDVANVRRRIAQALPPVLAQLEALVPESGTPPVKLPAAIVREIRAGKRSLARVIQLAEKLK